MTVSGSFNLTQATNSQSYAYKCWYNYNYGGNTMGISAKDMGEITQTWNTELTKWRTTAQNVKDENKYEISDDDFNATKLNAKNEIKDETGYNGGGKGKMWVRGGLDFASGAAGTLATTIGNKLANKLAGTVVKKVAGKAAGKAAEKIGEDVAGKIVEKAVSKTATDAAKAAAKTAATKAGEKAAEAGVAGFVGKAAEKAAAKAASKAGEEAGEKAGEKAAEKVTSAGKNIGWIITAPLALATGTAYMASKPNQEQKEACDALQDSMNDAQVALTSAQGDMEDYAGEIEELSDEAAAQNEDANNSIEEDKTEFDMYRASYEALMEKVNSGETLTEDERNLLNELVPLMQELGVNINKTQEETTDSVGRLYEEMGSYQDGYDDAAGTMAEVQGVTDYAESFDGATRTLCYVEGAAQTLNVASGGKAALQAGKFAASGGIFTAWAWGFAAMGAAGAAMSGVGAAQQFQWAGEVGTEIDLRKQAQDLNVDTQAIYDENIDVYAGQMEGVENLELEIPDDIEAPEEAPEIPTDSGVTTTASTSKDNPFGQPTAQGVNDNSNNNGINANNTDKEKDKEKEKS